ncbi:hypothetical protein [Streptomyces sp. NPDC054838]
MTSSDEATVPAAPDGVQLVPIHINPVEVPAGVGARDALLRAIAQEAQHLADKLPGQARPSPTSPRLTPW